MLTVQTRFLSFLGGPHLVADRIVNYANDDFAFETQRDRNTKVWDLVKIIHGAIERIDHPLVLARLVADNSLFTVKRVLGKLLEQRLGDEFLRLHVDREFDIVRLGDVHMLGAVKIFAKKIARRARSILGRIEIMLHGEVEELS